MSSDKSFIKILAAIAFVAIVATGCRTAPTGNSSAGYTDELGNPFDIDGGYLPGDVPMDGIRFENFQRVTDAGEFIPVYFDYNAYGVASSETAKISIVAELLRLNPSIVLVIEGHCDERGTNEYNMSLGEYRAQAVRDQLIGLGISATRIQTSSFGEERPADPGHTASAWSKNRRAEFSFYRR